MSFKDEVEFCIKFLKLQNYSNESLVFSPMSMIYGLATVYAGAAGNTAKEIGDLLEKVCIMTFIHKFFSFLLF